MARVAQRWLLVSVPREPLWRGAEPGPRRVLARPGQHARAPQPLVQALVRRAALAPRRGRGGTLAVPVDHAARAPWRRLRLAQRRAATGSPAARGSSRSGSRRPASSRSRTSRSPATCSAARSTARSALLWSVLFVVISVIYRPVEQLLSRTIATRRGAGLSGGHPLRTPADPAGRASRRRSSSWRLLCAGRSRTPFDGSSTLFWVLRGRGAGLRRELLRARLVRRASVVRALRRPGPLRVRLALLLPARGRCRDRLRADRGRAWGSPRRPSPRCAVLPWIRSDATPRRPRRNRRAARGALVARGRRLRPIASPGCSSPSRRCSTPPS